MIPICALDDLTEGACREFDLEGHPCFLVRRNGAIFAYRNYCPHRGVTLNWRPDDFVTEAGDELRCTTHDARFRVEDGMCTAGPCVGEALVPLRVILSEGVCFIASSEAVASGREG